MLFKQPNGKYSYISDRGKSTMATNLSKEEYETIRMEEMKQEIERDFRNENFGSMMQFMISILANSISDADIKNMGFTMTREEMEKHLPKNVVNKRYVEHDVTTYGKCPCCNTSVQSGIAYVNKKCPKCNQLLIW